MPARASLNFLAVTTTVSILVSSNFDGVPVDVVLAKVCANALVGAAKTAATAADANRTERIISITPASPARALHCLAQRESDRFPDDGPQPVLALRPLRCCQSLNVRKSDAGWSADLPDMRDGGNEKQFGIDTCDCSDGKRRKQDGDSRRGHGVAGGHNFLARGKVWGGVARRIFVVIALILGAPKHLVRLDL